jgi:hypothetical protein
MRIDYTWDGSHEARLIHGPGSRPRVESRMRQRCESAVLKEDRPANGTSAPVFRLTDCP